MNLIPAWSTQQVPGRSEPISNKQTNKQKVMNRHWRDSPEIVRSILSSSLLGHLHTYCVLSLSDIHTLN